MMTDRRQRCTAAAAQLHSILSEIARRAMHQLWIGISTEHCGVCVTLLWRVTLGMIHRRVAMKNEDVR